MNALKLVKRYARLKNKNNITKSDWLIVILNSILFIISVISTFKGINLIFSSVKWNDEYPPDLFDYISLFLHGLSDTPELLYGVLGTAASLMIIHMVLKK